MKRYKLIKEYPGSPKIGFIADVVKINEENYSNYPEYWEEIYTEFKQNDWVYVISGGEGAYGANNFIGQITTKEKALSLKNYSGELERLTAELYVCNDNISWRLCEGYKIRQATQKEIDEVNKPKTKWLVDEFEIIDITKELEIINKYNLKYIIKSPEGKIFDTEKDALLHHAKLKYPIGTKVKSLDYKGNNTIYEIIEELTWNNSYNIIVHKMWCVLYKDGKWAEIVEEDKGFEITDTENHKIIRVQRDNKEIYIDCKSKNITLNEETTKHLTNIAKTLLEDKGSDLDINKKQVAEVEIPKGYELLKIGNLLELKGITFNGDKFDAHNAIYWKRKQSTKSCKTCLFRPSRDNCELCTTVEYENWQSKQDLSNTKLWIGDNSKLLELIQKKVLKLGYYWSDINQQLKTYKELTNIIIGTNKELFYYPNLNKNEFENNYIHRTKITPQDLGIKPEEYEVKLVTEDGVKLYKDDNWWQVYKNVYNEMIICGDTVDKLKLDTKYFSTKQAAEKYLFDKAVEEAKNKYHQ